MDKSYIAYSRTYEYQKHFIKKYYEKNRDSILEKAKEKYICDCGSYIRISDKSKHQRSKKHQNFINSHETLDVCISIQH